MSEPQEGDSMTPEEARLQLREFAHDRYFEETGSAFTVGMAHTIDALLDEQREALLTALEVSGHHVTPLDRLLSEDRVLHERAEYRPVPEGGWHIPNTLPEGDGMTPEEARERLIDVLTDDGDLTFEVGLLLDELFKERPTLLTWLGGVRWEPGPDDGSFHTVVVDGRHAVWTVEER